MIRCSWLKIIFTPSAMIQPLSFLDVWQFCVLLCWSWTLGLDIPILAYRFLSWLQQYLAFDWFACCGWLWPNVLSLFSPPSVTSSPSVINTHAFILVVAPSAAFLTSYPTSIYLPINLSNPFPSLHHLHTPIPFNLFSLKPPSTQPHPSPIS